VKRMLGVLLIIVLVVSVVGTCMAFPATGKYETEERAINDDGIEQKDAGFITFYIYKSNVFYGKYEVRGKGWFGGSWSLPLNISANGDGSYPIVIKSDNPGSPEYYYKDLEEQSDGSILLHAKKSSGERYGGKPTRLIKID